MIDIHTHILPGMDDGARSPEISIKMLEVLKSEGVDTVALTPHFYPENDSIEAFIEKRTGCLERLETARDNDGIRLVCGAEVAWYDGIERREGLEKLCIGNSKTLLLEMPFERWNERHARSLSEITNVRGFEVVLAHVERYLSFGNKKALDEFVNYGIMLQVNASFAESFRRRCWVLSMLRNEKIHFVATDCHNMEGRAPNMRAAEKFIVKRLGRQVFDRLTDSGGLNI